MVVNKEYRKPVSNIYISLSPLPLTNIFLRKNAAKRAAIRGYKVLYCVVLCCTVLCCVVLCCTVLCCVVLCCTVLYCVVQSGCWLLMEMEHRTQNEYIHDNALNKVQYISTCKWILKPVSQKHDYVTGSRTAQYNMLTSGRQ